MDDLYRPGQMNGSFLENFAMSANYHPQWLIIIHFGRVFPVVDIRPSWVNIVLLG
jgi:hypothetical protein